MSDELRLIKVNNPLSCGFPSPAMDYVEDRISLDEEYIKHPLSTYLFETIGTSMINAFIPPRSRILVDRSVTPKNMDIVVVRLDGDYLVKFLKKNDFKCSLVSANPKYPDIEITEEMSMEVFGPVTTVIIQPYLVRSCML